MFPPSSALGRQGFREVSSWAGPWEVPRRAEDGRDLNVPLAHQVSQEAL